MFKNVNLKCYKLEQEWTEQTLFGGGAPMLSRTPQTSRSGPWGNSAGSTQHKGSLFLTPASWQMQPGAAAWGSWPGFLPCWELGDVGREPSCCMDLAQPQFSPRKGLTQQSVGEGSMWHRGFILPPSTWPCREETEPFLCPPCDCLVWGTAESVLARSRREPAETSKPSSEGSLECQENATCFDSGWNVVQTLDKVL